MPKTRRCHSTRRTVPGSELTHDAEFWQCFDDLPQSVRRLAVRAYSRWRKDPHHPGLNFKKIHRREEIYSVGIGIRWRAMGRLDDDTVTWFWIGSHADYDRLIG